MTPKRSRFVPFLLLAVLASSFPPARGAGAGGAPFLWEVRSRTATAHLLGSVHVLNEGMYPLDERIEKAFRGSDTLVVETDVGAASEERLERFIAENALYPAGDSLSRHVSRETLDLLRERLGGGLAMDRIGRIKPWALAITISMQEYQRLGLDPAHGIDRYFIERSRDRKAILELESIDHVPRLLDGLPDDVQELFLLYTLVDADRIGEEMKAVLEAWRSGDARRMESIVMKSLEEQPRLRPVYEALFFRRNREMTSRIEELLRRKGTFFIVVGAGHLVGREGIVERLRGAGHDVRQR